MAVSNDDDVIGKSDVDAVAVVAIGVGGGGGNDAVAGLSSCLDEEGRVKAELNRVTTYASASIGNSCARYNCTREKCRACLSVLDGSGRRTRRGATRRETRETRRGETRSTGSRGSCDLQDGSVRDVLEA